MDAKHSYNTNKQSEPNTKQHTQISQAKLKYRTTNKTKQHTPNVTPYASNTRINCVQRNKVVKQVSASS